MKQSEDSSAVLLYFIIMLHKGNPDLIKVWEFQYSPDSNRSTKNNCY